MHTWIAAILMLLTVGCATTGTTEFVTSEQTTEANYAMVDLEEWELSSTVMITAEGEQEFAEYDPYGFRWLQNATHFQPITEDNPLTAQEMERHFFRYRVAMPSYEEWSPAFDTNQDGLIDIQEYEQAKYLVARDFN